MRGLYTVTWSDDADRRLITIWNENPAIRVEIADAANRIGRALRTRPNDIGSESGSARFVVVPPLTVLYRIRTEDRQVNVIYVKLWDE